MTAAAGTFFGAKRMIHRKAIQCLFREKNGMLFV